MLALPMESVHPLVVHFPIALLLTATALDLLAAVLRRPSWHRVALWNLGLGVVGAAVAVWSGYEASEVAKHTFEIHQVMVLHRRLGVTTLVLSGVVLALRLGLRDRLRAPVRVATVVVLVVMAGVLSVGAHQGGRLVYEFGVGGSFGGHTASWDAHDHQH